jgi:hypothetical protein
MNTRGRKQKGRGLVLEVKAWLHRMFPEFKDHDVIVPATSAGGEDIRLSPELRSMFPYSIECKRTEGFGNIYKAMDQAVSNCNGHTPVVILRSNHREALVVMRLDDWEKLV